MDSKDSKDKKALSNKKYYLNNKDKISKYKVEYALKNKDKETKRKKDWYENNKDKLKLINMNLPLDIKLLKKEKKREYDKLYVQKNFLKLKEQKYKYNSKQLKNNPLFKLKQTLRHRIYLYFREHRYVKNISTEIMLGISYEDAKLYLEQQFKEGMSWENHGDWHIDHKIPLSYGKNEEEMLKLCHYSNLQPLWAKENLYKSNNLKYNTIHS